MTHVLSNKFIKLNGKKITVALEYKCSSKHFTREGLLINEGLKLLDVEHTQDGLLLVFFLFCVLVETEEMKRGFVFSSGCDS